MKKMYFFGTLLSYNQNFLPKYVKEEVLKFLILNFMM